MPKMDDSTSHFRCFSTLNSQMMEEFSNNEEHLKTTSSSQSSTSTPHDDGAWVIKQISSKPTKASTLKSSNDLQNIKVEVSAIRKLLLSLKIEPTKRKNKKLKFMTIKSESHDKNCCGDFEDDGQGDSKKFSLYEAGMIELYEQCAKSLRAIENNRHKICEVIQQKGGADVVFESKKNLREQIDVKTKQFDELSQNYREVLREKDEYQNRCEELTSKVKQFEELMDNATVQQGISEELEKKQDLIDELSDHISQLREHICECDKITEEKENLEEKYNKLQLQNKVLLYKLKKTKEAPDKLKVLEGKHKRLIEMQSRILFHTDRLRNAVRAKDQAIAELKCSCDEKDTMLRKHQGDFVEIFKATSKTTTTTSASSEQAGVSSCFNLSNELEALINSLYAEIDRSLLNTRLVEEQFEQNSYLKCRLANRETEMVLMRNELNSLRNGYNRMVMAAQQRQDIEDYYEYEARQALPPCDYAQFRPSCSSVQCCWVEQGVEFDM